MNTEQRFADLHLEDELARARRDNVVLERKVNFMKAGGKIEKLQDRLINCLWKEKYNVLSDLASAAGPAQRKLNHKLTDSLSNLIAENDELTGLINKKNTYDFEINNEIVKIRKRIYEIKKKTISDNQYAQRLAYAQQTLKGLENKLELANKTYCTIMTESRELREEIRVMMSERIGFNKLWFKYIVNLSHGKKILIDIVEQATIAYNDRDTWVHNLEALREWSYSNFRGQRREMLSNKREVDRDYELALFMVSKGQKRLLTDLHRKKLEKKQRARERMTELLDSHKQILEQIKNFTDIDVEVDKNKFFYHFCSVEEKNMSRFYYINNLRTNNNDLVTTILGIRVQIEEERQLHEEREAEQAAKLEKLLEQLKSVTIKADVANVRLKKNTKTLSRLYKGIMKLINLSKCDTQPFMQLLGSKVEINQYNAMMFYRMLENTVDELILGVNYKETRDLMSKKPKINPEKYLITQNMFPRQLYRIDQIIETSPCPLCIERDLVRNLVDTLQFVQTKEEVKKHLAKRLKLPDAFEKLHNVSACTLPSSRAIIQRRYQ
ncbi:hypothetical protein FQR65_LT12408 [Abscondita terminalis]|nr:hypothetical protein FQR65_LT12408 [Abscondita terminalis]